MPSTDLGAGDTEVSKAGRGALLSRSSLCNQDQHSSNTKTHSTKAGNETEKVKVAGRGGVVSAGGFGLGGLRRWPKEVARELNLG